MAKIELPYKRRLNPVANNSQLSSEENGRKSTISRGVVAVSGLMSRGLITFLASMAGAVVASFASIYFTLTTLEAFKAEEALRQFAIADLYRPLREKTAECLTIRSSALGAISAYSALLKSIDGYANEYKENEALQAIDTTGAAVLIKPIIEQLGDLAKKSYEGQNLAVTCQHAANNMATETATVLGLNKQYEDLFKKQIARHPKFVNMVRDDDIISSLFTNPSGTVALGMALKDGIEGEKMRMISALSKLKSSLEKSLKQSELAVKYQSQMTSLAYREDSERAQLFLSNLKYRFEVTPKTTLSKTLEEIALEVKKKM